MELLAERKRQMEEWGEQSHDDFYWLGILVEEVGEVAKSLIQFKFKEARKEIIECGAVCIAWIDSIDRRNNE